MNLYLSKSPIKGNDRETAVAFYAGSIAEARALSTAYWGTPASVVSSTPERLEEYWDADVNSLKSARESARISDPRRFYLLSRESDDDDW